MNMAIRMIYIQICAWSYIMICDFTYTDIESRMIIFDNTQLYMMVHVPYDHTWMQTCSYTFHTIIHERKYEPAGSRRSYMNSQPILHDLPKLHTQPGYYKNHRTSTNHQQAIPRAKSANLSYTSKRPQHNHPINMRPPAVETPLIPTVGLT